MTDFQFTVNEAFNKKHNEYLRDSRRLQMGAGILGVLLLLVAAAVVFLFGLDGATLLFVIVVGLFAIFSLVMVFVIPKKVGNGQELYDRYNLIPAVIAEVNSHDVDILALVNIAPEGKPKWALSTRNIVRVPGVENEIGAQIPSVAVTSKRSMKNRYWDEVNPMPIGWATTDKSVIQRAHDSIDSRLWAQLEKNIDQLDRVKDAKFNLIELDRL